MSNFKKNFQSFGKSLLFPISLLSFMAIFLGLAAALQNPNIMKTIPFLGNEQLQIFLGLIRKVSALPFAQLPLLFAMAIPLGMVKRDREVAVYSAVVGYIAMLIGISYILSVQDLTPATTSVAYLTGITEPIEFTFIFISPILWIMNAVFAGLSFLVPAMFSAAIGNIQGGIIDWLVFGVLQGAQTKWYIFLFLGPIFFGMYYFAYSFVITKFNVMTLGRNDSDFEESEEETASTKALSGEYETAARNIVEGLGGLANIVDVDNCISRLRVEVKDGSKVNKDLIKKSNPNGIIVPDQNTIHIVYGGRVTKIRNMVDDYIYNSKQVK